MENKSFLMICVLCLFVAILGSTCYATDAGPAVFSWPIGASMDFSTTTGWTIVNRDTTDGTTSDGNGFINGGYLYLSCPTTNSASKCQITNPIDLSTTRCDGIYVVIHIVGENSTYTGQFSAYVTDQENNQFFRSGVVSLDTTGLTLSSGEKINLGFYFPTISQMYRSVKYLQLKYFIPPGNGTGSRIKIDSIEFNIVK